MSAIPADAIRLPAAFTDDLAHCTIATAMRRATTWWRMTRDHSRLGWSPRSVLGKVIEEGCQGAAQSRVQPGTYLSPEVELTDRLVARMPGELREALVADVGRWGPAKVIAHRLGCSVGEYSRRREWAYGWLAGALSLATTGK